MTTTDEESILKSDRHKGYNGRRGETPAFLFFVKE